MKREILREKLNIVRIIDNCFFVGKGLLRPRQHRGSARRAVGAGGRGGQPSRDLPGTRS